MKCKEIEVDHQELRDEHVALNANFVSVREKLQDEVITGLALLDILLTVYPMNSKEKTRSLEWKLSIL